MHLPLRRANSALIISFPRRKLLVESSAFKGAGVGKKQALLLAALLTASGLFLYAEAPVTIAVGEWPPYVSADMEHYGLVAEIITAAFAATGIEAEYSFLPWRRAYDSARNGAYDATTPWVRTADREKDFLFSEVILTGSAVFYHLKSVPFSWKAMGDLEGLTIGGLLSASYKWYEDAKKAGINLKMELVVDEATNFRKLLAGRIDVFSLDAYTGEAILAKHFTPEERALIVADPHPIESWAYCLLFSKRSAKAEKMLSLFNEGLQKLKETGEDRRIARRILYPDQ